MDEVIKIALEAPRRPPRRSTRQASPQRGASSRTSRTPPRRPRPGGWRAPEFEIIGSVRSPEPVSRLPALDSRYAPRTTRTSTAVSADESHRKRTETMARRKGPTNPTSKRSRRPSRDCRTPRSRKRAAGRGRARRHARHPGAARDQDPPAPEDRQGPGGRERDRDAQAGPDLQDPAGADREEGADLFGGRARDACRTASVSCGRPTTTTCRAPTTSTSLRRRSASSTCAPATRSPARSVRPRRASATSP